jgi:hypothetical protein
VRRVLLTTVALLAALAPPAGAATPRLHQLVVFRDGSSRASSPALAPATAKVGRKRCTVGAGTPLAALIRSGVGPLSLKDYGSCSKRAADAGGLFVTRIGADRNKGSNGWVYKVGNVLGTAGAGDPSGPFGRGRMRAGARVTWFWCHVTAKNKGCPHNLSVSVSSGKRSVTVRVRQFNDFGKGGAAGGATVHVGKHTARAGANGIARVAVPRGGYSVWATQPGRIRSFSTRVGVM